MPHQKTLKLKPQKSAPPAVRSWKSDFIDAFEESLSVVDAAAEADVSIAIVKQALRDDKEFHEAFHAVRLSEGEKVQKAMIDRAKSGDPACARIVLPALLPEVYGNKLTIDINVSSPKDLEQVGEDKLDEIEKACLKLQSS